MLTVVDNYVLLGKHPNLLSGEEFEEVMKKAANYAIKYGLDVKVAFKENQSEYEFNHFVEEFKKIG